MRIKTYLDVRRLNQPKKEGLFPRFFFFGAVEKVVIVNPFYN